MKPSHHKAPRARGRTLAATAATLPLLATPALRGQGLVRSTSPDAGPERIVIEGDAPAPVLKTALSDEPLASPSSVTVRSGEQIKRETITSYGDLLRPVAGISVSNYDQGLGYGVTLRGFDEGNHGGEVAFSVDGVPVNNPSNNFGFNGYTNLATLIPELVGDLAVYRGPFNPRFGNFALGGAVDIHTVDRAPTSLSVIGGSYDYLRGLGVYAIPAGPVSGYTAFAADTLTGYRDNSGLKSVNSFTRLQTPIFHGAGTAGFRAEIYSTAYGAAGYLDRAEVMAGRRSETGAANRADGGNLTLLSFSTPVSIASPDGDFFTTLYVKKDFGKRWADFSLTPDDAGTQRLQIDDRVTAGGVAEKSFRTDGAGGLLRLPVELTVGVSERADLVSQDTFDAVRRAPTTRRGQADFTQQNAAAYARLQFQPVPWLKVSLASRYDRFFYNVSDEFNGRRVAADFGTWSPKGGLAVSPLRGVSIFGNYGEGLRSPDATADLLNNPDLRTAKQRSVEAGFTYDSPPPVLARADAKDRDAKDAKARPAPADHAADTGVGTFHFLADAYNTTLSNDVVTGPDGVTPQNLGRSRRRGVEVEGSVVAFHREAAALSLFANYSYVEAKLIGGPVHQFVPDVAAYHVNYGVDLDAPWLFQAGSPHRFHLSAYHQIIGPKHLTPDGLLYTKTFTRFSAKLAYNNTQLPGFGAFVGLVAYPDRRLEEVAFDFGGGQVGVSPKPLLNFQGGLGYQF